MVRAVSPMPRDLEPPSPPRQQRKAGESLPMVRADHLRLQRPPETRAMVLDLDADLGRRDVEPLGLQHDVEGREPVVHEFEPSSDLVLTVLDDDRPDGLRFGPESPEPTQYGCDEHLCRRSAQVRPWTSKPHLSARSLGPGA